MLLSSVAAGYRYQSDSDGNDHDDDDENTNGTATKRIAIPTTNTTGSNNNGHDIGNGNGAVMKANEKYQRFRTFQMAAQLLDSSKAIAPTVSPPSHGHAATASVANGIIDSILSSPSIRAMFPSLLVAAARSPILEPCVRTWLDTLLSPITMVTLASQRSAFSEKKTLHVWHRAFSLLIGCLRRVIVLINLWCEMVEIVAKWYNGIDLFIH
jgi:hypothetical protein